MRFLFSQKNQSDFVSKAWNRKERHREQSHPGERTVRTFVCGIT